MDTEEKIDMLSVAIAWEVANIAIPVEIDKYGNSELYHELINKYNNYDVITLEKIYEKLLINDC